MLKGQTNFDLFYMVIAKTYLYTDKDKGIYIYTPAGNKRNVALFILYNIYVGISGLISWFSVWKPYIWLNIKYYPHWNCDLFLEYMFIVYFFFIFNNNEDKYQSFIRFLWIQNLWIF